MVVLWHLTILPQRAMPRLTTFATTMSTTTTSTLTAVIRRLKREVRIQHRVIVDTHSLAQGGCTVDTAKTTKPRGPRQPTCAASPSQLRAPPSLRCVLPCSLLLPLHSPPALGGGSLLPLSLAQLVLPLALAFQRVSMATEGLDGIVQFGCGQEVCHPRCRVGQRNLTRDGARGGAVDGLSPEWRGGQLAGHDLSHVDTRHRG